MTSNTIRSAAHQTIRIASVFAVTLAVMALSMADAEACDSCNDAFARSIMEARSDSLTGQDLQKAMQNQAGLAGISNSALAQANIERQVDQGNMVVAQARTPQVAAAGSASASAAATARPQVDLDEIFKNSDFIDIVNRDNALDTPATSYVPQDAEPDVSFTVVLDEGKTYIGQGVMYDGFLIDGSIPGQTIIVTEGDIVEMTIKNKGTVPHGASIHAAYTQTSAHVGNVEAGETKSVRFRVNHPGVYMYHCAPGGHAIPMHVLFGQYGMMVVEPKDKKYKLEEELGHGPDLSLYILQHEIYASGKDAIEGNPMYTAFNGRVFRYVEEPIVAKPGDYVRVHYLNIGPNNVSTFHLVGIIWDYVYWQGHPEAWMPGGQTVTSGPSDSWVIEFRVPPEEGAYLMLDHSVGGTSRGAIGVLVADNDADRSETILSDGPKYTEAELAEMEEKAVRTISPFNIGDSPADRPVVYGPDVDEVHVQIIGNSYHPKVIEVEPGTKITWTNEDVFTYMDGEFSGIHNAVGVKGPEQFATSMLAHAESGSFTPTEAGEYDYICTPHPYMKGRIIVRDAAEAPADKSGGCNTVTAAPTLTFAFLVMVMIGLALRFRRNYETIEPAES